MKQKIAMLKNVYRKVYDYVRYDFREIVWPSSLPDPPGYVKPRKLTLKEHCIVFKKTCKLYAASWVRDIGPDINPEKYKKLKETQDREAAEEDSNPEMASPTFDQLAEAAKGGMEELRPLLQKVYMTRTAAYSEALKGFIIGYQEGIREVMLEKEKAKSQQKDDAKKI